MNDTPNDVTNDAANETANCTVDRTANDAGNHTANCTVDRTANRTAADCGSSRKSCEAVSTLALADIACDAGFEAVGSTAAANLVVRPEVRDMCAADRCHAYGRTWVCPPACGSLDAFTELIAEKKTALVVQTVAELEDEFDIEGMQEAEALHKQRFTHFARAVRTALNTPSDTVVAPKAAEGDPCCESREPLFLAAGSCTVCPSCAYPEAPCRFPDEAFVSLEAAGLVVSDVCEAANIPYYHGKGSIAYTSCVLV